MRPSILEAMNNIRSRRTALRLLAATGVCAGITAQASLAEGQCSSRSDHVAWVAESLERMQTIEPGMNRKQLLRVFTTEGGISTAMRRTFVSRDCPYFKVNVTFRRAAESSGGSEHPDWLKEMDDDVITTISGPYLQFSIMD